MTRGPTDSYRSPSAVPRSASTEGAPAAGARVQPGEGRERLDLGAAVPEGPPGYQPQAAGLPAGRGGPGAGRPPAAEHGGHLGGSPSWPAAILGGARPAVGAGRRAAAPLGSGTVEMAAWSMAVGATVCSSAEEIPGSAIGSRGRGLPVEARALVPGHQQPSRACWPVRAS